MEMNTRLQVEHPVTEMITGYDLVEWQLRIASGELLPVAQDEIGIDGHAMEARLYAEDPAHDFLPDSGRIEILSLASGDGIRIDNGFDEGDTVSVFYDPLLMKVIARGADRQACIQRLSGMLARSAIGGIKTNRDFLLRALAHPAMAEGRVWTSFLDTEQVFEPLSGEVRIEIIAAAVLWLCRDTLPQFRLNEPHQNRLRLYIDQTRLDIDVTVDAGKWLIDDGTYQTTASIIRRDHASISINVGGLPAQFEIFERGSLLLVSTPIASVEFMLLMETAFEAEEPGSLKSPMSGKVIEVLVEAGEVVAKGDPLIILEAMKMEHTISAPADGVIATVHYRIGDVVADGVELLAIEESA